MRRGVLWLAIAAVVVATAAAWGLRTTAEVQVTSAAVTLGPIVRHIYATGTVQAAGAVDPRLQVQLDVGQPEMAGVEVGQAVDFEVDPYPDEMFHGRMSDAAMIDVDDPDQRLRPGMTASVVLEGSRRANAVRIPNSALSFRPSQDVFRALGEAEPRAPEASAGRDSGTRSRSLWRFDGKRLTPIVVRTGLSNDQWTELVNGGVRPGESIVTQAVVRRQ